MSDEIEWGPWVEHDGKVCPCVGEYVRVACVSVSGRETEIEGIPTEKDPRWIWDFFGKRDVPWHGKLWAVQAKFIRYRIRKPRRAAVDRLADIVTNPSTPITAPEGPTREKVPANNTRDRA